MAAPVGEPTHGKMTRDCRPAPKRRVRPSAHSDSAVVALNGWRSSCQHPPTGRSRLRIQRRSKELTVNEKQRLYPRGPLARMRSEPARSGMILISIPLVLALFTYFGSSDFYRRVLSTPRAYNDLHGFIYHHVGSFVILGCGSVLLGMLLGFRLRDLGLGLGDAALGTGLCSVIVVLIVAPATFAVSYLPGMAAEYPVAKSALETRTLFTMHAAFYMLYYVGWETFFRGYALFGLAERFGAGAAILIQTIPSTLIHTSIVASGKPFVETLSAVPAGIFLGWLAMRTGSIWYGLGIHAAAGLLTDFWQYLHAHGQL